MTRFRALLGIGLSLVLIRGARAESPTPFTAIVRAHLQEWGDASGTISPEQIDRLMKRRKIQGEDAAALADLKMKQKDPVTKLTVPWTMKRVEEYEALVAEHPKEKSFDKAFKKALAAIKADPHTLYAEGAPHLSSIQQARSGDCWLLSTIGAMIQRDPRELRSLISDDGDNLYSVHFAYHTFRVSAPTDAEIAAYTSDKADGDWLYVLENAVGQYREDFSKLHKVAQANDDALVGGNGTVAFKDILGRGSDTVAMTPDKPQNELVRTSLSRAFKERRLVILSTTHDKSMALPSGIAKGHAMAVIGWDAASDKVTIWNPWGNTNEPKGTGPYDGYKTEHGVFTMPLTDFTKSFATIHIENDKPAKPQK